ncbi:MAG: hypothetical protein ACKVIG_11025 [Flavobacteriales bacterium]
MILPKKSHIRYPPTILRPKQVVIFNALRYSIDICDISFRRLIKKLSSQAETTKVESLDFPEIFSDVWSIINNAQMFGKIIRKEFAINKNEPNLSEITKAIDFRNSNQHFEERISQVLSQKDIPIYGFLSWLKRYPVSNEFVFSTIYSGTFTNKKMINMPVTNKRYIELNEIIQEIEFTNVIREKDKLGKWCFNEQKISISKLVSDLKIWVDHFDNQINKQIENIEIPEKHISDLIIQMAGHIESQVNE